MNIKFFHMCLSSSLFFSCAMMHAMSVKSPLEQAALDLKNLRHTVERDYNPKDDEVISDHLKEIEQILQTIMSQEPGSERSKASQLRAELKLLQKKYNSKRIAYKKQQPLERLFGQLKTVLSSLMDALK